jgi:hypothetical protein
MVHGAEPQPEGDPAKVFIVGFGHANIPYRNYRLRRFRSIVRPKKLQ